LKGNWFEAERELNKLLRRDNRDLEARLMLATLLRHTKRFDEATRQLNVLVRLEGAKRWELEIRREGELITEARKPTITNANTAQANSGED
jgi:cytochrome c-type biogenesis protein CcmH/NrfG